MTLSFTVVGVPEPSPRPRAAVRRGKGGKAWAHMYVPSSADAWKNAIGDAAVKAAAASGWVTPDSETPMRLHVVFRRHRPASHFRSNGQLKPNAPYFCIGKSDKDNLEKVVMDAMQKAGIFPNDAQVVGGPTWKTYVMPWESTGCDITLQYIMQIGQKVVCVNDEFTPLVRKLFKELPEKGKVYVVRSVFLGRSKPLNVTPGDTDGEVGLLLVGVNNPPDPVHLYHQELGFSSERFRPLEEVQAKAQEGMEVSNVA